MAVLVGLAFVKKVFELSLGAIVEAKRDLFDLLLFSRVKVRIHRSIAFIISIRQYRSLVATGRHSECQIEVVIDV